MIAYLKGKIIDLELNNLLILTDSWIAYEVFISQKTYFDLLLFEKEEYINIYIHHYIRENNENLFWFFSKLEKKIFEELIKISWVWWKLAISILSIWIEKLWESIISLDNKVIQSIKWVWKKMAEKIIIELKDKDFIKNMTILDKDINNINIDYNNTYKWDKSILESVKSSLVSMWYNIKQVENLLLNLPDDLKEIEDIISYIIKKI